MAKNTMAKSAICLWYDKDAEAAARFYAATFPDSTVDAVHRATIEAKVRSVAGVTQVVTNLAVTSASL